MCPTCTIAPWRRPPLALRRLRQRWWPAAFRSASGFRAPTDPNSPDDETVWAWRRRRRRCGRSVRDSRPAPAPGKLLARAGELQEVDRRRRSVRRFNLLSQPRMNAAKIAGADHSKTNALAHGCFRSSVGSQASVDQNLQSSRACYLATDSLSTAYAARRRSRERPCLPSCCVWMKFNSSFTAGTSLSLLRRISRA